MKQRCSGVNFHGAINFGKQFCNKNYIAVLFRKNEATNLSINNLIVNTAEAINVVPRNWITGQYELLVEDLIAGQAKSFKLGTGTSLWHERHVNLIRKLLKYLPRTIFSSAKLVKGCSFDTRICMEDLQKTIWFSFRAKEVRRRISRFQLE